MFFFDTYAFMALDGESRNYERFKDVEAITTRFNQVEYGWLKIKAGKETNVERLEPYVYEVNLEIIKISLKIRLKNKKMSMPDAIGYATALFLKIPFITGDDDFKGMPNVEFVKE